MEAEDLLLEEEEEEVVEDLPLETETTQCLTINYNILQCLN